MLSKRVDFIFHQTEVLAASAEKPSVFFDMGYFAVVRLHLVLQLWQKLPLTWNCGAAMLAKSGLGLVLVV